ncbi:hypothetical protein [Geopsychrobacter electrodiphilus]|uniref:hypothetical protein n=1 Tax=Geopsychrobacter electrodiphilus TaxID=225196 RepID=UPI000364EAF3|nr:hypothetical protein [Geopsychrobacter electrodiphilus]
MRTFLVIGLISLLFFAGCGYKEGVVTGERVAYLYFSGNTDGVAVSIDGGEKFSVKPGRDNQYRVAPGTYMVRIYRGGTLIVERLVSISDGVAKEIGVE